MKKDSEDLVIVCRTIGFRHGRVLPGCLSFASAGPTCAGPFVGLEWRAGFFRDERRSGNQAGDIELLEAAGGGKAAGAGLVGDFQDASG
jgi:hypothetical protein